MIGGGFDCIPLGPPSLFNCITGVAQLSSHVAPALTPIALERTGASGTLHTTLYAGLHVLISPAWGFGTGFVDNGGAASRGLAQASPTIVVVWADRSVPICPSSPTTPVPWTAGGTGRASALLCPSQGSHQSRYLVP